MNVRPDTMPNFVNLIGRGRNSRGVPTTRVSSNSYRSNHSAPLINHNPRADYVTLNDLNVVAAAAAAVADDTCCRGV